LAAGYEKLCETISHKSKHYIMIIVNIRIEVQPEKKKEIIQALDGMTAAMRKEKGYDTHYICHDGSSPN